MNPDIGYCPHCRAETPSLPAPALGTCAICFNHQMKPCSECNHSFKAIIDGVQMGTARCSGSPMAKWYTCTHARRNESLCGGAAAWGDFDMEDDQNE